MSSWNILIYVVLLSGLFLAIPTNAYVTTTNKIFTVDGSCKIRNNEAIEQKVDRQFVQTKAVLTRAIAAAEEVAKAKSFVESNKLQSAWLNGAHMLWGLQAPELYGDSELKQDDKAKIDQVAKRTRNLRTLLEGKHAKVKGANGRQLSPKTASLACSRSAYASTDDANSKSTMGCSVELGCALLRQSRSKAAGRLAPA